MPRMPRVNRSRLRSSGMRNMFAMPLVTIRSPLVVPRRCRGGPALLLLRLGLLLGLLVGLLLGLAVRLRLGLGSGLGGLLGRLRGALRRLLGALGGRRGAAGRLRLVVHRLWLRQDLDLAACLLDGGAGARGDAVRLHRVGALPLAPAAAQAPVGPHRPQAPRAP